MRPLIPALLALLLSAPAPAQGTPPKPTPKPSPRAAKAEAKEPGKNLKVFKGQGLNDETLDDAMDFMSVSLGVACYHCHVRDEAKQAWVFDKDDKPAKAMARTMILMTRAINKSHFKGETTVTCATCHNGRVKPEGMPPLPVPGAPRPAPPAAVDPKTKDLPELDALLAKWTAGAGGAEALQKIAGRLSKGTVDQGGGRIMQLEIAQKPGMRAATQTTPRGVMKQGFDGTAGWVQRSGKTTPMDPKQLPQARIDADLALPLHLKDYYPMLAVMGREQVDGHEAFAVAAKTKDESRLVLYFDAATGLLVRRLAFSLTPLGRLSAETTWSDFRAVDGVQVPFKSVSRNAHGASVTTFSEIKAGPVDDAVFKAPAN
jgi:hypothetical protein